MSENQQIKTRACNGSGLEFGSFSTVDCFLFPGLCRKSTHQTANTSQRPCRRRCGGDVHFSVTRLRSRLRVRASPAERRGVYVPRHASARSLHTGRKHAPSLFSHRPRVAASCLPHRQRLMTGSVARGSESSSR